MSEWTWGTWKTHGNATTLEFGGFARGAAQPAGEVAVIRVEDSRYGGWVMARNGKTFTSGGSATKFWARTVTTAPARKPRADGLAAVAAPLNAEARQRVASARAVAARTAQTLAGKLPEPTKAAPPAPSPAKANGQAPQAKLLEAAPTAKNADFARYCQEQTGYHIDPVAAMVLLRLHREWQKSDRGQALKGSDTARERKPKTVRRSLPFDPEVSTDAEVLAAVRPGSRLVWQNSITGLHDSADVYCRRETKDGSTRKAPHLPLRSIKITNGEAGRRVLTFPSEDGGIRSVALGSLVSVR